MIGETGWQLSHGERSRLYIARALMQDADVLIFDESFAALDPENVRRALECVLRRAHVPVLIVGPEVTGTPAGVLDPRTVLCAVSRVETGAPVVAFAAEIADRLHARLVVQHVIRAQECKDVLAHHCISEFERQLLEMVPMRLRQKIHPQPVVVPGEPAQKLLDQSRELNADLIVMGAYGASAFSAITRHGVVYRVTAEAECPVMTLSPTVLEAGGADVKMVEPMETYLAGVI